MVFLPFDGDSFWSDIAQPIDADWVDDYTLVLPLQMISEVLRSISSSFLR